LRIRRISRLKFGLVRLTVRETLASRAFNGKVRAFPIVDAERNAVRRTEIKFQEIAVKMLLSAMLIHALHAALED
jgi:hypothetical protein